MDVHRRSPQVIDGSSVGFAVASTPSNPFPLASLVGGEPLDSESHLVGVPAAVSVR